MQTTNIDENFFENIDKESKAYMLGFWDSDGCNDYNSTRVTMFLQARDKSILERFAEELNYKGSLKFLEMSKKKSTFQDQWGLRFRNRKISDDLAKQGCVPRKSLTLQFPNFNQVPKHLIRHFIRGIFDGDGSLCFKTHLYRGKYKYLKIVASITSSTDFCNGLARFLRKELNLNCCVRSGKQCRPETSYIVIQHTKNAVPFLSWLYDDSSIYLERKYNKFQELKEFIKNFYKERNESVPKERLSWDHPMARSVCLISYGVEYIFSGIQDAATFLNVQKHNLFHWMRDLKNWPHPDKTNEQIESDLIFNTTAFFLDSPPSNYDLNISQSQLRSV